MKQKVSQEPPSLKAQYLMFSKLKVGRDLLQRRCNKEIYNKYS